MRISGLALLVTVFLAACGGAAPAASAPPSASAPPRELTKVVQAMPTISFGSALPAMVGIEQGFYRAEGIDLQLPVMASAPAIAAVVSGQVDIATGGTAIRAAMQGAPLKTILFYFKTLIFEMVAAPEIKSVADLKGKRVGNNGTGSTTEIVARILLKNAGLDPNKDVTFVNSPAGQEVQTLTARAIDAIVMNVDQGAFAEAQGFHVIVSPEEVGRQSPSPQGGWAVSDTVLQTKPDLVKRWLRATVKALQFSRDHQAETVAVAAKAFQMDPAIAKGAVPATVQAIDPNDYGGFTQEGIDLELANDKIANKGDFSRSSIDELTDLTLLRQAQKELGVPCKSGYRCS
jgi:NitT/TauT family transport system substrate-binding protein